MLIDELLALVIGIGVAVALRRDTRRLLRLAAAGCVLLARHWRASVRPRLLPRDV
ncbi:MAG TPA: hypothetical protein VGF69_03235 [Thermoanaerobaculia bacterium]|jgi:hypothetical protein